MGGQGWRRSENETAGIARSNCGRRHELLRRVILKLEFQLQKHKVSVLFEVVVAEAVLAKNTLTTVAGQTPYRAVNGRDPHAPADSEPTSATQLDDFSGGVPGLPRHNRRVSEAADGAAKTRHEQLQLQPGDLVEFGRKPAIKNESGWRGHAHYTLSLIHI